MIPVFRKNESFLQALHPATVLVLALALMVLSLLTGNPFCQVTVILATALLALAAGVFRQWLSWWKLCAVIFLAALIINPLVSRYGETVIWRGPTLPVFGHLFVTAEAVAYGAGMGLRLAAVIWVFALVTLTVDPDSVLGLLRGRGAKSALVSALTMRMVPTMMRDASDVLDAQRSRGIVRDSGGKWAMLKSRLPLVKRVLATSLDRGIGLAEAMESRAYGSGTRSRFREHGFRVGDGLALLAALALVAVGVVGLAAGWLSFDYYPTLAMRFGVGTPLLLAAPVLLCAGLLLLSWAWGRWHWLRLRV